MTPFRAQLKDVPRILECARQFTSLLGIPLDEAAYTQFWRQNLLSGGGAIWLLEADAVVVGGIGGILKRNPLTGLISAVESFWYVKPEYRGGLSAIRLHACFERWAEEQGADDVNMIFMEKSMPEAVRSYYQKVGYELLETVYTKALK